MVSKRKLRKVDYQIKKGQLDQAKKDERARRSAEVDEQWQQMKAEKAARAERAAAGQETAADLRRKKNARTLKITGGVAAGIIAVVAIGGAISGGDEAEPVTAPDEQTPTVTPTVGAADTPEPVETDEADEMPDWNAYLLESMQYDSWSDASPESWAWCVTSVDADSSTLARVQTDCTPEQLPDDLADAVWNFLATTDDADGLEWVEVVDTSGTHFDQVHRSDNYLASRD